MKKTVTVYVAASMVPEELEGFVRVVRKWDGARPEVQTVFSIDSPTMKADELVQMFKNVDPPIAIVAKSEKGHPDWQASKRIQKDIERLAKVQ